jgi:hypothetical protein
VKFFILKTNGMIFELKMALDVLFSISRETAADVSWPGPIRSEVSFQLDSCQL